MQYWYKKLRLSVIKWQKSGVFYFSYCVQKFSPIRYLGEFFCTFFNGFELDIKFCVLWYHIKFFQRKGPFCQQKRNFFTFITVSKSFRPIRYLGKFFCTFFNGFELDIKFCVLWYPHQIFSKKGSILTKKNQNRSTLMGKYVLSPGLSSHPLLPDNSFLHATLPLSHLLTFTRLLTLFIQPSFASL
jgi:hypothetical protein